MIATIDIGTHSVLLLVGEKRSDGGFRVVEDRLIITRLGEGVMESGILSQEACDKTISALKLYLKICKDAGAERIKTVGTAALRNAQNAKPFIERVKMELGLGVEVISAEKEARLTYEASSVDFGKEITVVDIGGGSSEIISGPPPLEIISIPIGCVSLTEEFIRSDPIYFDDEKTLRNNIYDLLYDQLSDNFRSSQNEVVATAGTATTLLAMHYEIEPYDGKMVHGKRLDIASLGQLIDEIRSKNLNERSRMPGLMPERAQVIFAGAVLLEELLRFLGTSECTISDRGVRWGLFNEEICKT